MRILRIVLPLIIILSTICASPQRLPVESGRIDDRVNDLLSKMTLEEKLDYIGGVRRFYIRAIPRLGVPELKMADGPAGVRNYGPATTFGGIGLAAMWDPQLVRHVGMEIGRDARARGVHFMLGPGVNIQRAPMGGRNFEYFGEDPFLAARTTVAYIEGVQSQGVIATVKHFAGNNSEFDRHNTDSIIDERTLREIYLPAFEAAVKEAHVGAIMNSYNLLNGEHATENSHLNNDIAKKEWGFDGIIMSDWDATYDAVAAANGGLDLEMPSGKFMNRANLEAAIKAGRVSQDTIDDKVRRILRKAIQFKFLDREQADLSIPLYNAEAREVALEAARSSMVLLKNSGNLLPLDKTKTKTIAIVGPNAYPTPPVGGGSAKVVPFSTVSYLEGLTNYLGTSATVLYYRGIPEWNDMVQATEFTTPGGEPGLKAEYFANTDLSGTPTTRTDRRLDYVSTGADRLTWPGTGTGNDASARWTATFKPKTTGTYEIMVNGLRAENSGYKLWLDDKLVIDQWENAVAALNYVSVPMQAGSTHQVKLEYWRKRGPAIALAIADTSTMVDPQAKQIAANADAVIVAAGFDPTIETESADRTFRLPPGQDELIRAMLAANKKVIVVMTSGGNVDSSRWIADVPAYLQAWYAGQESGTALAQLLFGDYSPSGRLPVTFEKRWQDNATFHSYYPQDGRKIQYSEGVFVGYRHFDKEKIQPLFPFGFGLTYSTFEYKNLTITGGTEPTVSVSFDVTNTGTRAAAEVAQVYIGDSQTTLPRPPKELKGFEKVLLNPGETRRVNIRLDQRAFQYYDAEKHAWTSHPGNYEILIGPSAGKIELRGTTTLAPPRIGAR